MPERGMERTDQTETPAAGKNYLLAIGIDNYPQDPLDFAVRDAEAITKVLQTHYQFEPENCQLLINEKATCLGIKQYLAKLKNQTGPHKLGEDDSLVVFYAGHGYLEKDMNMGYWLPHDGEKGRIHITNAELLNLLNAMPCRHVLLISDSCFSGTLLMKKPKQRGFDEQVAATPSRWAITSGRDEPVLDESPFADALLAVLAQQPDATLRTSALFEGISAIFKKKEITKQVPLLGSLNNEADGQFVFHRRPAPPDPAEAAWQAALAADTLVAYDDFLEQYPDSPHAEEAETRMRALEAAQAQAQAEELALFEKAKKSRLLSHIRDYLKKYPQGRHVEEAKKLKQDIVNAQGNAGQPPSASPSSVKVDEPPTEPPVKTPPQETKNVPPANFTETVNGVSFTLLYVQGGTLMMGSPDKPKGFWGSIFGSDGPPYADEKPAHRVTLDSYHLGQTPVTQALWRAVMGADPPELHNTGCDECPVEGVSWDDAQDFIQKLNQYTGKKYTLPTEAQWEFAARGGTQSRGYLFAGSDEIDEVAWYGANYQQSRHGSQGTTHPVATKKANELGLYDMSGNVWEWCQDWYNAEFYDTSEARARNPVNLKGGSNRVSRGGSWGSDPQSLRVAGRSDDHPTRRGYSLGFRLARIA